MGVPVFGDGLIPAANLKLGFDGAPPANANGLAGVLPLGIAVAPAPNENAGFGEDAAACPNENAGLSGPLTPKIVDGSLTAGAPKLNEVLDGALVGSLATLEAPPKLNAGLASPPVLSPPKTTGDTDFSTLEALSFLPKPNGVSSFFWPKENAGVAPPNNVLFAGVFLLTLSSSSSVLGFFDENENSFVSPAGFPKEKFGVSSFLSSGFAPKLNVGACSFLSSGFPKLNVGVDSLGVDSLGFDSLLSSGFAPKLNVGFESFFSVGFEPNENVGVDLLTEIEDFSSSFSVGFAPNRKMGFESSFSLQWRHRIMYYPLSFHQVY